MRGQNGGTCCHQKIRSTFAATAPLGTLTAVYSTMTNMNCTVLLNKVDYRNCGEILIQGIQLHGLFSPKEVGLSTYVRPFFIQHFRVSGTISYVTFGYPKLNTYQGNWSQHQYQWRTSRMHAVPYTHQINTGVVPTILDNLHGMFTPQCCRQ